MNKAITITEPLPFADLPQACTGSVRPAAAGDWPCQRGMILC
jgi:hypothetical protein